MSNDLWGDSAVTDSGGEIWRPSPQRGTEKKTVQFYFKYPHL